MSRETIAGSDKDKIVYFSPPRLSIFDSARKRYEETKNKPLKKFYFRDIDEDLDIAASAVPRKSRSPLKEIQNENSDNHNIFRSENTNGTLTIDTKKRQNVLSKNNHGNESPVNEIKKSKISTKNKNEKQNDFKKFENFNMPPLEAVQVASPRLRRSLSGTTAKLFPDVLLDDASLAQSLSPRRMSLRSFKQKQSSEESCQSSDVAQMSVNLNLSSCSRVTLRTKYRKKDETNASNDSEMPLSKIEIQNPDIPSSNIETSMLSSVVTSEVSESDEENNLVSAFNSTFTTMASMEEDNENDITVMNSTFVVPETDVTDIASGTQATNTISDSQSVGIAASYIESLDSSLLRSTTISLPTTSRETVSTYNSHEYELTSQVSDGLTSMTSSDQGGTSRSNVCTVDDKTYVLSGQSSVRVESASTWSSSSSGNSTFLVDSSLSANSMTWDLNETNATTQIHRDRVIVPDSDLNISGVSWLGASKNTNSEASMSPRSAFSSSAVAEVAKATDLATSKSNGSALSKVTNFATAKSNGSAVSKGTISGVLCTAMQGPCHNVASSSAQSNMMDGAVNEVTSTVQSLTKSRIPVPIKSDKKKSEQKSKIPIFCGSNLMKNSPIGFGSGTKQVVTKTTQTNLHVIPRQNLNFRFTGNQPRPEVIKFTGAAASPSTRVQRVNAKPTTMAAVASQQATTRTGDARAARREQARSVAFKTATRTVKSYKDMVRTNKTHELLMAKRNIK